MRRQLMRTDVEREVKNPPIRRKDLALTDFLDPPSALENPDQYELIKGVLVPKRTINGKKAEIEWSAGTLEERTSSRVPEVL